MGAFQFAQWCPLLIRANTAFGESMLRSKVIVVLLAVAIAWAGVGCSSEKGPEKTNVVVHENASTEEQGQSSREAQSEAEGAAKESAATIRLVAGQENEYSQIRTWNAGTEFEETRLVYYVPAGTYEVTNTGAYRTQVSVYQGVTVTEEGWEEPANVGGVIVLEKGEQDEITVPDGFYIYIAEPTEIELTMK